MKIKTSELTDLALDWAVAKCEGWTPIPISSLAHIVFERVTLQGVKQVFHLSSIRYSTDWAQGGPIIEREK